MIGHHIRGCGRANARCAAHDKVFSTRMIGTFNVSVPQLRLTELRPSIVTSTKRYWFVRLHRGAAAYYAWAVRDNTSKQRKNVLELLTKRRLPDALRDGPIHIEILEPWSEERVKLWADEMYWFQTFSFSPVKRADNAAVWGAMRSTMDWSGLDVLDFGCHYGFYSFEASKSGASVLGVDKNAKSLAAAVTIRDWIMQQDAQFAEPSNYADKSFDVVLYLSVHHQIDPSYSELASAIAAWRRVARRKVFVELIMPPMFPQKCAMTEAQIDEIVGGQALLRYKHGVRGTRKLYAVEAQ